MRKLVAILLLTSGLAGCGLIDTLINGIKSAQAVEADLQRTTGMRPQVTFNWHNGRLRQVTVTFPRLDDEKPLQVLAEVVRGAVGKEFGQKADDIVLAFSIGSSDQGRTAQAD